MEANDDGGPAMFLGISASGAVESSYLTRYVHWRWFISHSHVASGL